MTIIIIIQMVYLIFNFLAENDESYLFKETKKEKKPFFKKIGREIVRQMRENKLSFKDIIMDTYHLKSEQKTNDKSIEINRTMV